MEAGIVLIVANIHANDDCPITVLRGLEIKSLLLREGFPVNGATEEDGTETCKVFDYDCEREYPLDDKLMATFIRLHDVLPEGRVWINSGAESAEIECTRSQLEAMFPHYLALLSQGILCDLHVTDGQAAANRSGVTVNGEPASDLQLQGLNCRWSGLVNGWWGTAIGTRGWIYVGDTFQTANYGAILEEIANETGSNDGLEVLHDYQLSSVGMIVKGWKRPVEGE